MDAVPADLVEGSGFQLRAQVGRDPGLSLVAVRQVVHHFRDRWRHACCH